MRALLIVRTAPARLSARLVSRVSAGSDDSGMTTAEYAVGTVAACGFGGVLWKVVENPAVVNAFKEVVLKALDWSFG